MAEFVRGDQVYVRRQHPVHGLCGFREHLVGTEGVIVAAAPSEWPGHKAYLVKFRHPISKRVVSAVLMDYILAPKKTPLTLLSIKSR